MKTATGAMRYDYGTGCGRECEQPMVLGREWV